MSQNLVYTSGPNFMKIRRGRDNFLLIWHGMTLKELKQMESKIETEILRCFDSDEIETLYFDMVTEPTNPVYMFVFPASKKIADVMDIAEVSKVMIQPCTS